MGNFPLISNGLAPWHWALAGLAIAGITLSLLWVMNKPLGISTGFENLCSLVLRSPYLRRSEITGSHGWRLTFLLGLLAGGFLSAWLGGGWVAHWRMGMLDTVFGLGPAGKIAWTFVGGVFIGVGTRLAGGCTSGHGIFGMSNMERASIVSTVCFLAAGTATTFIIYRVIA